MLTETVFQRIDSNTLIDRLRAIPVSQSIQMRDPSVNSKPIEYSKRYLPVQTIFVPVQQPIQQPISRQSFTFTYHKPIEQRQEQIIEIKPKVGSIRQDRPPMMPKNSSRAKLLYIPRTQITFNHQQTNNISTLKTDNFKQNNIQTIEHKA